MSYTVVNDFAISSTSDIDFSDLDANHATYVKYL